MLPRHYSFRSSLRTLTRQLVLREFALLQLEREGVGCGSVSAVAPRMLVGCSFHSLLRDIQKRRLVDLDVHDISEVPNFLQFRVISLINISEALE